MRKSADVSHRELLLDLVRRSDEHPTADAVFMQARSRVPSISLTTVYRNLRRLVADGRLRERLFDGVSRFDAHLAEHAHVVCTECGAIVDVAAESSALIAHLTPSLRAWQVELVDVELRGRCPTCRKKAARRAPRLGRRRAPRRAHGA